MDKKNPADDRSDKVILYAEDDPNDAFFFATAIRRAAIPMTVFIVDDGQSAIDWLAGQGAFADRRKYPLPSMLVLDLKMPRKCGFEVLEWVRNQKHLENLPVIILSSSGETQDKEKAKALGATDYFVKTATAREIVQYISAASS
ncbi:MAG: response regulator [Opitutales bacterium]